MSIRARGPRLLVRENEGHQSRDINGVFVVLREKDKLVSGQVLSVGDHPKARALGVEVGETVWFRRECGYEVGGGLLFLNVDHLEAAGEGMTQAIVKRVAG